MFMPLPPQNQRLEMLDKSVSLGRLAKAAALVITFAGFGMQGCSRDEAKSAPAPIAANASAGQVQAGFYVAMVASAVVDSEPAIELSVSEPLASEQDFNKVITVTNAAGKPVDGGWSMDYSDTRVLRFYPVKSGENYKITVSKELLSKSGAQFSRDYVETLKGVEQPPTIGFSGQGSLLPARATEGLPIRTVNVAEIDVQFLRVKDANVGEAIREHAFQGRQGGWNLERLNKITENVYSNRFQITDTHRNTQIVSFLPVQTIAELKRPGLYYAIMRRPSDFDAQFEVTHYVVSDVAVHVRRYQNRALVLTRSLSSGAALADVQLSLVNRYGQTTLSGKSNGDGQAIFEQAPDNEMVLIAQSGDDLSVLPFNQPALDLSEYEITGGTADRNTIHIWSGRDLYRPGEELKFSALLRDFDGKPIPEQPVFAYLRQPDGKLYASAELKVSKVGYLEFKRTMPGDVATGRWKLEMGTDPEGKGRHHIFDFRIEEFLPERLKLELASTQARLKPAEPLNLDISGAYLYGAPAGGNRFTAKYVLSADASAVPSLKGYIFGDQVNKPKSESVDAIDIALGSDGKLSTPIAIPADQINGPISVAVVGELFETGGRAVTRVIKRTVWPAEQLVAVHPLFNDNDAGGNARAAFEVMRVGADGTPSAANVAVKLVRERRDYRWSYKSGLGWVSDFTESVSDAGTQDLALNGKSAGRIEFPVEWGNYRLEITDPQTGLVTRYPFYAGWSWGSDNTGPDARPDKVKLALDKSAYRVGDTVKLTVTPPEAGVGLLLVESDQLLSSREFSAGKASTLEIKITPDMDRHDIYISAMVFKPGDNSNHITPKRAVGMIHLQMDRTERQLAVSLSAPAKMLPAQPLNVAVSVPDLKGQTAFVTVHAVDQGITNITRFTVPDPFKHFFAQRAYAIDLFDVYGRIIESLPGALAKLRFGGDGMLGALPQANRSTAKVQTVDLFSGAVVLDAKGNATVPLDVPDFNGSLKVSAVVFSDQRYGFAQAETIVRAPVVVEVSMPRVFAPGDTGKLTIDVQNFTDKPGEFSLKLLASDGLKFASNQALVSLADQEKKTLTFDVTATPSVGIAKYSVGVTGNGAKFERKFESVVRPAWSETRRVRFETLADSGNGAAAIDLNVASADFYPSTVRSRVSLSARSPIPVADAVKGLFEYPYGCIEQTTSKLMPYLTLDDAALAKLGLPASTVKKRAENISFGLGRIASMQAESGHFNYWPSGDYTEPTLTPFVADVLIDAQTQGFAMPPQLLQKALERLKESLLSGGEVNYDRVYQDNSEHLRISYNAYAGYVLARVNQAPLGSLRSIFDSQASKSQSPLPLVHLGLALKAAGDAKRGDAALALAFGEKWPMKKDFWQGDYGSELRDHALALALTIEAKAAPADRDQRLLDLTFLVRENPYMTTQERVALVRLAKALSSGTTQLAGTFELAGKATPFSTGGIFAANLTLADLNSGARISAPSPGPLYLLQQTVGISRTPPQPGSDQFVVARKYFNIDGSAFSGDSVREGDRLIVGLTIQSKIWANDVLLVDLLPGGFEAENLNLLPAEQLSALKAGELNVSDVRAQSSVRFEEFRDDRYVLALPLSEGETRYFYVVRAVSPGSYVVPPTQLEDMYRTSLTTVGVSIPARVTVLAGQ
jgi:alpha-2-macroglobulin